MRNNMDMMILDGSFLGGKGFYSIVSPCKLYETGHFICVYSSPPYVCAHLLHTCVILQATYEKDEDNPAFNVYS